MKRMTAVMLLLCCILAMLTGCWNRRELNTIAITVALGFDKVGDRYAVSAQIVNPSEIASRKGGGGKGAPVVVFRETGDTVHEALRKMLTDSPRRVYLSHIRMVVFSEELAREGIGHTLDFLSRDHEVRTDFFIAIAKGHTAEKILRVHTIPQELIPANHMYKSLEASDRGWSATATITLDDLISEIVKEGKHAVVTGINLYGDHEREEVESKENVERIKPISSLHYSGMAVFKFDKLVGWLNEDQSKGYNYTQGRVRSTVVVVGCPDGGELAVEILRTKEKMKGSIRNGKPVVDVKLRAEGNVADVECKIDISKIESIAELENLVAEKIRGVIEAAIDKAQREYKVDIFGFGEVIHRTDPKAWKQIKETWDEEFVDTEVSVTVDVKIRRLGTTAKSFQDKMEE